MKDTINIQFKQSTIDDLLGFSEILKKDVNVMIEEDASMTNLDYDEFWDGLDIG